MNRLAVAVVLAMSLASHGQVKHEPGKHVILPNPKLLKCVSSGCAQLWQDNPPDANDIRPKQVVVDPTHNM